MAQTVIGLDIGSWSIKAAVLEMSLRRFTLLEFREHHIPTDPQGQPLEEELAIAVGATLSGIKDKAEIITAVPGSRVLNREIELPFSDEKRIKSVLGFQLEGQLPKPLDELVYDHVVLEKTDDGAKLLCSAVDRGWLTGFLADLKEAGADPKLVNLDTVSLVQLMPHLDLTPLALPQHGIEIPTLGEDGETTEGAVAMVDIGHTTTSITIVRGDQIEAVRTVGVGGHHMTLALMNATGVDYGQAETIKHRQIRLDGFVPPDVTEQDHAQLVSLISPTLSRIVREVRTTIHAHAHRSGHRVERIVAFGGTTRMPGLVDTLREALAMHIDQPRLSTAEWSKMQPEPTVDAVLPKAASLALSLVGDSRGKALNFRQGELAYESDFKAFRDRAAWLAILGVIFLAIFFGRQWVRLGQLEDNHAQLTSELEEFSEKVLGSRQSDFKAVLAKLSKPPEVDTQDVFPEMTAFRAFYEISAAQETVNQMEVAGLGAGTKPPGPKDDEEGEEGEEGDKEEEDSGYKLEFSDVDLDLKGAMIKGEVNSLEALEELRELLEKRECFREVEVTDTNRIRFKHRAGWLRFTIKIAIQCTVPEEDDKGGKR